MKKTTKDMAWLIINSAKVIEKKVVESKRLDSEEISAIMQWDTMPLEDMIRKNTFMEYTSKC